MKLNETGTNVSGEMRAPPRVGVVDGMVMSVIDDERIAAMEK